MKKSPLLSRLCWWALSIFLSAVCGPDGAGAEYKLVKEIQLPGDSGWDYLAVHDYRLFVTHGDRVHVINLENLAPAGEIAPLAGVHGIAFAGQLGRGFISNGRTNVITVFDLRTLAVIGEWPAGGDNPDAILYEPESKRVCCFNGGSNNVTILEAATGKLVGTIALGGKPEFADGAGAGQVFVNIEDRNEIVRFDARTLAVTARWPLAPAHTPTALAFDHEDHRLFVGCRSKNLLVINSETGAIVASLTIGAGVDAVSYDPRLVYVSNSDGTLNIFHQVDADHYKLVQTLATAPGARTHAIEKDSGRIFVSSAEFGPVPPAAAGQPRARPAIVPGSFKILVYQP